MRRFRDSPGVIVRKGGRDARKCAIFLEARPTTTMAPQSAGSAAKRNKQVLAGAPKFPHKRGPFQMSRSFARPEHLKLLLILEL